MARQMKDSGVEWIGEIPEGWAMVKLKVLLEEVKKKNIENKRLALKFTYGNIVNKVVHEKDELYLYTCVEPNDVIVNGLNLEFDFISQRVGLVKTSGVITSAYICMRPTNLCNAPYICYLLKAADGYKVLHSMGRGLRQILSYKELSSYSFVLPPIMEQIKVAAYLDLKCAEIDKLVEQTRATIEEYKKLKQAIITEAVTKGVRGARPMKPSGVEWIGDIPEEWSRIKLKSLISHIESGVSVNAGASPAGEGEVGVLKTSCVSYGRFNPDENKSVNKDEISRVACPVQQGCLIVSRMNTPELVGACGYVQQECKNIYLPDRLWQVHISPDFSSKFIYYYLSSKITRSYYASIAVGTSSSMQNISQQDFCCMYCTCPRYAEQQEIAAYLDAKCAEIDRIIEKKEQLIEELGSYKKSLIYEYVTGKKEVSHK